MALAGDYGGAVIRDTPSDAAEAFQAAEGILDKVAAAVSPFVVANGPLPVAAFRNSGDGARLTERTVQAVGIVAFVTEQLSHATSVFEEGGRGFDVVADVTRCQHRRIGTAGFSPMAAIRQIWLM